MLTNKLNSHIFPILLNLTLVLTLLIGSAAFPTPARADTTITVTTLDDNLTDDGLCSLREAINNANADSDTSLADCSAGSGTDTIIFADGITTITLGSTLPDITDSDGLTINGGGDVTISGNNLYRIFTGYFSSLTLNNLTIANGKVVSAIGAAISGNQLTLIISNSTFSGNSATNGGAIFSLDGTITITDSTFSDNSAISLGGAIAVQGTSSTLTITNGIFSGNSAGGGSGLYNEGTATITNGSFTNNTSGSSIYNAGTLTITNGMLSGNTGLANGGGIYNNGTLTLINSSLSGNSAPNGGGIYNLKTLTITNSTFSGNQAIGGTGGGITNYNINAHLTVTNSTFSGNSAPTINGGGIFNNDGSATIRNSTFSGNSSGNGGDIGQSGASSSLNLYNNILANSAGGGNCTIGLGINVGNNNLIEDVSTACGFTDGMNGNIIGSDPALGTLTGSPAYFPLNSGSPAINAGDDTICAAAPVLNTSQNGFTRPQGTHCDIGSFELPVMITLTLRSVGANDGWVLESTETSNIGGTLNAIATTFNLGDDAADKQYRALLHFDTSSLADNAVITKVMLKLKKQGQVGTNPFTLLGDLVVDMRKPSFGAVALAPGDFQMAAGRSTVATFGVTPVSNWYSAELNASGRAYVNKTGTTQFRLLFATDDNDDNGADYMKFFSGNAGVASRPQLIIEYMVP